MTPPLLPGSTKAPRGIAVARALQSWNSKCIQEEFTMPTLCRITVFPIKALPGIAVSEVALTDGGALKNDREYALFDSSDGYVNGKRHKGVHRVATQFDLDNGLVDLSIDGDREWRTFSLNDEQHEIARFLGGHLGLELVLRRNSSNGYPDDAEAWGPTIISTATLQEVAGWFVGLDIESVRRRFRANLEIDGVPPFWEDQLYGPPGKTKTFEIGGVRFEGVNPCRRCVVPTRDPDTGQIYPRFAKILSDNRRATLPEWAHADHFQNPYRLSVNTRVDPSEADKTLRVGDFVVLA